MNAPLPALLEALSRALGEAVELTRAIPLGGGDINHAAQLVTDRGDFFAKWSDGPGGATPFTSEARALEILRTSGTRLSIPRVFAARDPNHDSAGFLLAEWLEPGKKHKDFDADLGRGLAELHRATRAQFGFEVDTYCGTTLQPNPASTDWIAFFRMHRLGHQLRLGVRAGLYSASQQKVFEHLLIRLEDRLAAPEEPPALVHGDLWSGNRLVDATGRPALVDPAAYYAHREAELGMMTLFGGFSAEVYAAYEEAWPLAAGWRERNVIYRLYHVMNHATLFGGGYVEQAVSLAKSVA